MTEQSSFPIIPWYASLTKEEREQTRKKILEELRIVNKLYPHARSLLRKARKINSIALQGKKLRTLMGGAIYLSSRLRGGLLTQNNVACVTHATEVSISRQYHLLVKLLGRDYDPDLRDAVKHLIWMCRFIRLTHQDPTVQERVSLMIRVDYPQMKEDEQEIVLNEVVKRLV